MQNAHVSLPNLLMLLYLFSLEIPVGTAEIMTGVSNKTAIDWYNFFRDICTQALISLGWKLGESQVVEIDESVFSRKRKYGQGNVSSHQQWVFGMVERNTKRTLFKLVRKRNKENLWPLITTHILLGATIHHDDFATYKKLHTLGYVHGAVNHSKEFVSKDGVHTNTMEGTWGLIKQRISSMHGVLQGRIDGVLDEFSYRHFFGIDKDIFWVLIYHISVFYPVQ